MILAFDAGNLIVTCLLIICGLLVLGVAGLSLATYIVTKRRAKMMEKQTDNTSEDDTSV